MAILTIPPQKNFLKIWNFSIGGTMSGKIRVGSTNFRMWQENRNDRVLKYLYLPRIYYDKDKVIGGNIKWNWGKWRSINITKAHLTLLDIELHLLMSKASNNLSLWARCIQFITKPGISFHFWPRSDNLGLKNWSTDNKGRTVCTGNVL